MAAADHDSSSSDREFLFFVKLFKVVNLQADVGIKLYKAQRTDFDRQFYTVFNELNQLLDPIQDHQEALAKRCSEYDFINPDGTRVKNNGFRSMLYILQKLLEYLLENLQKCARERGGLFYSAADHLSTLTAFVRAFQGMEMMLENAIVLMNANPPPTLLNDGEVSELLLKLACAEDIARDAFYGKCLGFQYSQALKPILQFLAISMASYEEWHSSNKEDPVKELLNSLWKGSKYLQHPTQRGLKIAKVTDNPNIYFAKAFWSLTEREAIKTVVKFVSLNVDISKTIETPAKNIVVKSIEGEDVTITPPFSDMGYKPVTSTLISFKWRSGQPSPSYGRKPVPAPPSDTLLIHFHGGGFVAQSSKSHENYLRWWSRELDCPILSVDYSLAPEAPFPRALEECVFVYAWALNNLEMLGTTGKRIVFAGDSAGGNLVITSAMKIKSHGLRLPDHLYSYYPATIVRSCATPSRFLSMMDPLLPCGIMISCLQAYTGKVPDEETMKMRDETRTKILLAKGYIVPSDEKIASTGNSGGQSTTSSILSKLPGMQRNRSSSNSSQSSKGGGSSGKPRTSSSAGAPPPRRPPPPKSMSVDSSVGSSDKPPPSIKPMRPPPPTGRPPLTKSTTTAIDSNTTDIVSFSSLVDDSDIQTINKKEEKQEIREQKEDKQPHGETTDAVVTDTATQGNENNLTEVDLSNTTEQLSLFEVGEEVVQQEEKDDVLAPLQSTTTTDTTGITNTRGSSSSSDKRLDPTSSVAVFFPSSDEGGDNGGSTVLRLGRRIPSQDQVLSDSEIERLSQELVDTYRDADVTKDPYMSPAFAPDDLLKGLPPTDIIACSLDPLLDDSITFAHKLKSVGQPVTLTVLEGISHGFLSFTGAENVTKAQQKCLQMMKSVMCPRST